MKTTKMLAILVLALGLMVCWANVSNAAPMGTAFTYQGRLMRKNRAAKGLYDLEFKLFDNPADGNQLASTIDVNELEVIKGYFTIELDFGDDPNIFNGDARWLEIDVRPSNSNDPNDFVTLSPRQEITPTPYALYAMTAGRIPGGIIGSGTANYIAKFTGPNAVGDSVIYESTGSIGIGTTNPGTNKLKVVGNIDATGFTEGGSNTLSNDISGNAATATNADKVDGYHYSLSWPTTLGNIQGACSNDFHNIGGTDDDVPDSDAEVPDYISINNGRLYAPSGSGNVGIGTSSPQEKLEVNGKLSLKGATYSTVLSDDVGGLMIDTSRLTNVAQVRLLPYDNDIWLQNINSAGRIYFSGYGGEDLTGDTIFKTAGNVGIGTMYPAGKLDVNGSIYQRGSQLHADYVFEPGYELESIEEHCRYMWENKHLKAIPEKRFDESGQEIIEVGAHRKGIVEELEKAHIYIVQLHKQNRELETRLVKLEAIVARLNVSEKGGIK